jgi:hypothetical protein
VGEGDPTKVRGKGWIHTSQDGKEVVLESLNCALSMVTEMHVRGDQLKLGLPCEGDGLLVGCTGLVVQDL